VEWPGSRPLTLEPEIGPDFGGLSGMAAGACGQGPVLLPPRRRCRDQGAQEDTVRRLFHACRRNRLEMLLEIIPSKVGPTDDQTGPLIQRFYDLGIYPDWWKLEPFAPRRLGRRLRRDHRERPPCARHRGAGAGRASEEDLAASLALAARHDLVKGFAVGRTIFGEAARGWLAGEMTDGGRR
jgi:5-dehydro-2-deoxygluconokinase